MGVPITGTIIPTDPGDTYATTDPLTGIDGWRSVADHTERNAITAFRRRQGMAVWTRSDNLTWTLNPSPWAFDDTDWTLFAAGLTFVSPACRVATTGALTATYANGTLGVGATLTNSTTQAAISIDGVSLSASDLVLVKNQAAPAQNGIYSVTTVGSGATNWVLTRATNYDQSAEIISGSYAVIGAGTTNVGTLWVMTGATPITVGTTAITFTALVIALAGTVTQVNTGTGLTGGPITTAGTIAVAPGSHNVLAGYNNSGVFSEVTVSTGLSLAAGVLTSTSGTGSVTSVATGTGLTGGPITTTGTVSIANGGVDTAQLADSGVILAKIQDIAATKLLGNPTGSPAAPSEITLGTNLSFSGSTLNASGGGGGGSGSRTFSWSLGFASDVIVAADQANWVICTANGTFSSWWTAAKVGPVGADLVFDVLISTDGGATFATLWTGTPSDQARIVDGSSGNTGTTFEVTSFSAGDLLRFDVTQVGSTTAGQGVTLSILGTLS